MNNYAPLQGTADNLAKYGRYGDSMLVHMNPIEVQGIAALSPRGLTTNPVTGQPEAWSFLIPMLGSMLGSAAWGGAIGPAAAGAIGSGLARWAQTGDFEKGLASGITGFGMGKILGAGQDVAMGTGEGAAVSGGAVAPGAADLISPETANIIQLPGYGQGAAPNLGLGITDTPVGQTWLEQEVARLAAPQIAPGAAADLISPEALGQAADLISPEALGQTGWDDLSFGQKLTAPFTAEGGLGAMGEAAMTPGAILPIAAGVGETARQESLEELERLEGEQTERGRRDRQRQMDILRAAWEQIGRDYPGSANPYSVRRVAGGGIISINPGDYSRRRNELSSLMGEPVRMQDEGRVPIDPLAAAARQASIRGSEWVAPPEFNVAEQPWRAGFDPEHLYFGRGKDVGFSPVGPGGSGTDVPDQPSPQDVVGGSAMVPSAVPDTSVGSAFNPSPNLYDLPGYVPAGGTDTGGGVKYLDPDSSGLSEIDIGSIQNLYREPITPGGITMVGPEGGLKTIDLSTLPDKIDVEKPSIVDRLKSGISGLKTAIGQIGQPTFVADPSAPGGFREITGGEGGEGKVKWRGGDALKTIDVSSIQDAADAISGDTGGGIGSLLSSIIGEGGRSGGMKDSAFRRGTAGHGTLGYTTGGTRHDTDTGVTGAGMGATMGPTVATAGRAAASAGPFAGSLSGKDDSGSQYESRKEAAMERRDAKQQFIKDLYGEEERNINPNVDFDAALAKAAGVTYGPVPEGRENRYLRPGRVLQRGSIPMTDMVLADPSKARLLRELLRGDARTMRDGGIVRMQDEGIVPGGGITDLAMAQGPMPQEPMPLQSERAPTPLTGGGRRGRRSPSSIENQAINALVEQTAMAVLGQIPPEQAEIVIQRFIDEFGQEAFQMLRQQVLSSVVPGAQTEGMIEGQGDGTSDEIMGMIGDQQRVAVSPGEFVVPADVVSGIGNGSTDAGAAQLDGMMDQVRQARTGVTRQPPDVRPEEVLPV